MKIELNKFYKTRAGHKVRIYAVDGGGLYPIHGAVFLSDNWRAGEWKKNGVFGREDISEDDDIVSEWEEPQHDTIRVDDRRFGPNELVMACGLTKRELIAAMAMQGLLSSLPSEELSEEETKRLKEKMPIAIAINSVFMADLLIAELAKERGE